MPELNKLLAAPRFLCACTCKKCVSWVRENPNGKENIRGWESESRRENVRLSGWTSLRVFLQQN